jgi:HD-GYP domain-containing protein (c-di-GMP phosphodiesterase class II)
MHSPIALRRVSIAWKLTGFFFLFGVLLSYAAFLSFGRITTTIALRVGTSIAANAFSGIFTDRGESCVANLAGSPNERLVALEQRMPFLTSHEAFTGLSLYGRAPNGRWIRFFKGFDGFIDKALALPAEADALDTLSRRLVAIRLGMVHFVPRAVPAFLSLPPGADGTEWALGADVDATGIKDFIFDNGGETALFGFLLAALSLVLGRLFARRFTRPLIRLAGAADEYGRGVGPALFDGARRDEIGQLGRTLSGMAEEIERRRAETEARMATMEAMNRIDKAVLSTSSRSELLTRVAAIIDGTMKSDAVSIALRDDDRGGWSIGALSLADDKNPIQSAYQPFVPDGMLEPGLGERFSGYCEMPIRDTGRVIYSLAYDALSSEEGLLAASPLRADGRYLGALIVIVGREGSLSADERRTFTMLADQAAVALRSILEREAREDNFMGVIRSLSRAIDAKSRWTAGHSERVSESAALHDVGKIGVGEAILDKPGKLTPEEYEHIKLHPEVGASMLEGIRSFEPVVPAVLHHHERWDGSGYPSGLVGEGIPLAARIIAVADVWDAIRDDRPYRKGYSLADAVTFMEEQSGRMFDPRLVEAFLAIGSKT